MKGLSRWITRPVAAAMVLAVLVAVAGVALLDVRIGPSAGHGRSSYAVIINYYGVDAGRIERDISMPLEDAVSVIPGVDEITSVSEFGKSRLTVTLTAAAEEKEVYLLLRDAVDRVYGRLPRAVQKPVIVSSSLDKRPVFIVTFSSDGYDRSELNRIVEKEVKAAYGRIDGTGEIEVGGGETREIHIRVKPERAAAAGLSVSAVASLINAENVLLPVGRLSGRSYTVPITVKGKFADLEELRALMINGPGAGPERLDAVADVEYGSRERESVGRVNGAEQPIVYIESSGSANLVDLGRRLREETIRWQGRGLQPEIILDSGRQIEESIAQVFRAILVGIALVTVLMALASGRLRRILVLSVLIPLVCLLTAAVLSLLGISLDSFVLAGIAVGIGSIVDGAIVLTETLTVRGGRGEGRAARDAQDATGKSGPVFEKALRALGKVVPSLFSSMLTTVVVLVPLFFLGNLAEGIRSVSVSVGLMIVIAFLVTVIFIPPFFLYQKRRERERPAPSEKKRRLRIPFLSPRKFRRFFTAVILFVMRRPRWILLCFAGLLAVTVTCVILMGADISGVPEEGAVFVHVEYEAGDSVAVCDERTALLAERLKRHPAVERVETNAKFGSAEMVVRFRPQAVRRADLTAFIKQEGLSVPGGFVYVPESSGALGKTIEAAVLGDDNARLRELAQAVSRQLSREPWVEQTVLHFKEGPPMKVFHVDPIKAADAGITASFTAGELRWALHGPVALKWIEDNREMDLRVMSARENVSSTEELSRLVLQPRMQAQDQEPPRLPLSRLGSFEDTREESKIYRKNRQRAVFFTVHTQGLDLDAAIGRLNATLAAFPLPQGYAFELDKAAARLADQFRLLWAVLGLALLLVYMILAGQAESLLSPLLMALTVPLSLAPPLIVLFLSGGTLTTPVLIGLIILTGMAVNNAILVADLVRENIRRLGAAYSRQGVRRPILFGLRRRIRDLLLISGTTVIGALPLLIFQSGGEGMLSALSFAVFWGILGSVVVSVLFLPAFMIWFPRVLKPFRPGGTPEDPERMPIVSAAGPGKRGAGQRVLRRSQ